MWPPAYYMQSTCILTGSTPLTLICSYQYCSYIQFHLILTSQRSSTLTVLFTVSSRPWSHSSAQWCGCGSKLSLHIFKKLRMSLSVCNMEEQFSCHLPLCQNTESFTASYQLQNQFYQVKARWTVWIITISSYFHFSVMSISSKTSTFTYLGAKQNNFHLLEWM